MLVITIQGIPKDRVLECHLEQLVEDLQAAVENIRLLRIKANAVMVFMPDDLVRKGLGEELVAFVTGFTGQESKDASYLILLSLLDAIRAVLTEFGRDQFGKDCKLAGVFLLPCELTSIGPVQKS